MKYFYSLLLIAVLFAGTASAQSLNPGQVTDNVYNKALLSQTFSLVHSNSKNNKEENQLSKATGSPYHSDISGHQEINFQVSYNAEENNFTGITEVDSTLQPSSASMEARAQSHFNADASTYDLRNINFMQLKLSMRNNNAALTITNLKLNGMDITGTYTANTSGEIYWHLIYGEFGSNFTVTGTINIVSNSLQADNDNKVELSFGASGNLSPAALSVYWGEVNAGEKNRANIINWNTNKEENNDRFIIERSTDGLYFKGIGLVNGAGNRTTISSYNFTDTEYAQGTNYYRIKQVDLDGHTSYSVVIRIDNNTTGMGKQLQKANSNNGSTPVPSFTNSNTSTVTGINSNKSIQQATGNFFLQKNNQYDIIK